jgi:predicted nucleic acid-binding protein
MKQPQARGSTKAQTILSTTLITLAVVVIGLLGIEAANGVSGLNKWLHMQTFALLAWRLALYSSTAYAWYRMRRRLNKQGFPPLQHQRLLYAEIAAVAAIALLELQILRAN